MIGDFSRIDRIAYDRLVSLRAVFLIHLLKTLFRTLLRLKDGGTLGLDTTPPASERTLVDDTPIVVGLHGLTGGEDVVYMIKISMLLVILRPQRIS